MAAYFYDTPELNHGPTTINPYGRKAGIPLVLEAQIMHPGKNGFLYGTGISAEMLSSRVRIDSMLVVGGDAWPVDPSKYYFEASGSTRLTNIYVNLNPFVGKRWVMRSVNLDVLGGMDIAFCLSSKEKGSASGISDKTTLHSNVTYAHPSIDLRPRVQVQATVRRMSYMMGYSLGLVDHRTFDGLKAYSGFLRLGVGYKFN
jgi:hypothetical protein